MKAMAKILSVCVVTLVLGALGAACGSAVQEAQDDGLGQSKMELAAPSNSYSWGWGNVSDVSLGQARNVAVVAPGATISGNTNFYVNSGSAGCPGCISQIVLGVDSGSKTCLYNGTGVVQSSSAFTLTAPTTPGLYPVRVSSQWMWNCQDAVNAASESGDSIVGLIAVHGDPSVWGWGRVSNVRLNGDASHRIQVAPGAQFSLDADYFIDAGAGGCPGCISQVVLGVEGGSKACVYSGTGVVQSSTNITLTAPTTPGIYPVWSGAQWMWNCQDAYNASNGGTPLAFVEVVAPSSQTLISVDTAGCNTNVAINNAIGQSFRVSSATTLEKIEVWIKPELYYTTSYGLEVFDGEGTGGAKLATSATTVTLGSQTGGTPSDFQAFTFVGQGVTLQPDHAYTFRLVRLSQYSGAFSMCGNVYGGGIQYWLGYSPDSPYDVAFKLTGSSGSVPPPQPTAGVYQGCYTDDGTRALPAYFGDGFTKDSCIAAAFAAGYHYAGLQYYGQCFAGNQLGYSRVSDAECGTPCNSDPSQMCGGGWRNTIYTTGR